MKLYILTFLAIALMCSCESYEFATNPVTGQKTVKDTPYERRHFAQDVNQEIQDELAGRKAPRVDLTWNGWWVDLIGRQRKYLIGDSDFHISYIIEARRKVGLPELKFGKNKK